MRSGTSRRRSYGSRLRGIRGRGGLAPPGDRIPAAANARDIQQGLAPTLACGPVRFGDYRWMADNS